MADGTSTAASELDRFREQWRQEVAGTNRTGPRTTSTVEKRRAATQQPTITQAGPSQPRKVVDYSEQLEPKSYHDLPDKEAHLKLVNAGQDHDRDLFKEPESALEHYERAVEKETQGQLGDSLKHYRQAFKLDDAVDQTYKKKHFPVKAKPAASSLAVSTTAKAEPLPQTPQTLQDLLLEFGSLRIDAPPPMTDASPPQRSLLGELPEEILAQILTDLALADVASFARTSLVCKRLAYLVMTEQSIWRSVALESPSGFRSMLYRYTCDIGGNSIHSEDLEQYRNEDDDEYDERIAFADSLTPSYRTAFDDLSLSLLKTTYANSWRQMFRTRPRIRFNGCYISTVNYLRSGASNTNTLSWGVPVHMVTYFRYLRFFRDGTVISLLTTTEPVDVVHHLVKNNLHDHHGNMLPSAVMKDALRGRWRLTGPNSGLLDPMTGQAEVEGDVLIETEGVTPKYTYAGRLAMSHAGKSTRNNKLAWKSFRSYNRLTDDWAEFNLKNDKAYYWSRVKSFNDQV